MKSDTEYIASSLRLTLGTHFPKRFSFCDVSSAHFHPQHYSLTLFADCSCHLSPNLVAFQDSSRHPPYTFRLSVALILTLALFALLTRVYKLAELFLSASN
jgi:hypothetical protein